MLFSRWKVCLLMLIISSQVHSARNILGTVGESAKLKNSELSQGPFSEVSWFYNETQKILTWDKGGKILGFETSLKTRIRLDDDNITLHIRQLQKEDSSTYKLKASLLGTGKEISEHIRLDVYERLTKPKVTSDPKINDNGTCLVNVTCSVEQVKENVIYSWTFEEQGTSVSSGEPILSISWKSGEPDQYTCTARNPVSNDSTTIYASELCAGIEYGTIYTRVLLYLMVPTTLVILFMLGHTFRVSRELIVVILPSIFSLLITLNWTQ